MFQRNRCAFAVVLGCLASSAWAQATNPDDYNKLIAHHSDVGTLTDTFAGDHIDLSSGGLSITQTDIDLPGNNALPVRVGRRFQAADAYAGGHFRYWSLDIPNVHGTFALATNGWQTETGSSNRCSQYSAPPIASYMGGTWDPNEYWHGTFFYLPGSGDQELLQGGGHVPSDGATYPVTTKEGAAARCVALASTSESTQQGEGFEMVTQDGVVYTLNQMVTRYRGTLTKTVPDPVAGMVASTSASAKSTKTQSIVAQPMNSTNYNLPRYDYFLFPTKVTDRFGNTVTYTWSTTTPWQLLHITASDGRHLDFAYVAAGSEQVASVSDGTRTWQYGYSATGSSNPDTLTLPDGTTWIYNLAGLHSMPVHPSGANCTGVNNTTGRTTYTAAGGTTYTGSITGPSGAIVTYTLSPILLGRSYVAYNCVTYDDDPTHARPNNPYLFLTAAVVGKTITGPGLPANGLAWSYSYGPTNNCWDGTYSQGVACTSASPTTRSVLVTAPDNAVTRYTFGNRSNVDEGLLYKTEYGWDGSQAKRTVQIDYGDPQAVPYGGTGGWSPRGLGDYELTSKVRPQRKITTTQQGRAFIWAVAADCGGVPYCFDAYARPTKVVKSSAPTP